MRPNESTRARPNPFFSVCPERFGAGESPLEICHCVSDGKWHDGRSRSGRQSRDAAPDPVADFSHGYRQTAGIPHRLQSNKFNSSHTSFSALQTNKFFVISFHFVPSGLNVWRFFKKYFTLKHSTVSCSKTFWNISFFVFT